MPIASSDLESIVEVSEDDLRALAGAELFITGGTGFVGTWLVNSLHHANSRLKLGAHVTILTRDARRAAQSLSGLTGTVRFVEGDVMSISTIAAADAVIHAATPASAALNDADPDAMRRTIIDGTRALLTATESLGTIPILMTSSGAIYGPQPQGLSRVPESYEPAPSSMPTENAYAMGKRQAEALLLDADNLGGPAAKLARLFAFAGPGLPLDTHFAIGNFIRDAIAGGPILVRGDGSAVRSYMYAGDLISALLAVLVRGETAVPYNIGSPHAVSMLELSSTVERVVAPGCGVTVAGLPPGELPTGAGNRYLPDISRLAELMGRDPCPTDLEESIRRTEAWARNREPNAKG